ncbi:alpha mannosidase-like protein [Schizosaccharomyces cryophilus OY26]|uniref:alpha-1,2-Mannosidase n=1 Tax=Schizosaccharomyces cryophilus (strain OY26 / ATCC MYA-4695 / CBS 11777 / NBRC 106824 / NRRL Y48691) TaxID=653667 RepID=S9X2Y1_SCHCR|nr:alpha mannosidase-like protein [Schizosaccharomyces cryophilus OY26]EPY51452.1 alpha mannosidase-like protein [Schizosaccharomyces cryophilus OY26]
MFFLSCTTWFIAFLWLFEGILGYGVNSTELLELRELTRELFYHGYDNYLNLAFPLDELAPLSCKGLGPDFKNPLNLGINDVRGNYLLTLIDTIDTLIVLNDRQGFHESIQRIIQHLSFETDTKVQIFEATIRILGGLLSGHIFASNPEYGFQLPGYNNELLDFATELGERLLPAFRTPTEIPFARINLMKGVSPEETNESCSAGASSLMLEFSMLSILTGDQKFRKAAENAFFAIWNRRSSIGLLGNSIDVMSGKWIYPVSGIGAGIDSFYEYALKSYILLDDVRFLAVWEESLSSIRQFMSSTENHYYQSVYAYSGTTASYWVDSLGAYFPGLLVLAGELESAKKSHLYYFSIYSKYGQIPERFNVYTKTIELQGYPLRPEFAESTYYLYRATRDPFYLNVGKTILNNIEKNLRTSCGFASLDNLETGVRSDRMESFFLSETLKYLYLLFDEENIFHSKFQDFLFTTEGHLLPINRQTHEALDFDQHRHPGTCTLDSDDHSIQPLFFSKVASREDFDFIFQMVESNCDGIAEDLIDPYGICARPMIADVVEVLYGNVLLPPFKPTRRVMNDIYVPTLIGNRIRLIKYIDNENYSIFKIGAEKVEKNDTVYLTDPNYAMFMSRDALYATTAFVHIVSSTGEEAYSEFLHIHEGSFLQPFQFPLITLNYSLCDKLPVSLKSDMAYIAPTGNCSWLQQAKNAQKAGMLLLLDQGSKVNKTELMRDSPSSYFFGLIKPYVPPTVHLDMNQGYVLQWNNMTAQRIHKDAPCYFQNSLIENLYVCETCSEEQKVY